MVQLPFIPAVPFYRFSTQLDDAQYIFDVRWNDRDGAWYFDLRTEDATMIRAGIKIVLGALLGDRSASANFPPGVFLASDLAGTGVDAGIDDLGSRVCVYYYSRDELA